MKTIGVIGGVSWQATIEYYRIINECVSSRLGGHHSAKIFMACMDFETLVEQALEGMWDEMADDLTAQVLKLEKSGADFFIICANTIHKVADKIASQVNIPILNIVDATAKHIEAQGVKRVTLLGTKFTMEDGFYQAAMSKYNIEVVVPDEAEREFIHKSIYGELTHGKVLENTREGYFKIINSQVEQGSEGIILGCTEIPLLIKEGDVSIPLFDTTRIHAEAAAQLALE